MEVFKEDKRPVFRWIVLALFALILGGVIALYMLGMLAPYDSAIYDYVMKLRDDTLTMIAKGLSFMANTTSLLVICVLLVILPTRMRLGFPAGVATGLSALCQMGLKELFARPRPDASGMLIDITGFSFPSGHATSGAVFYLFIMTLLCKYFLINKRGFPAVMCCIIFPLLVIAIGLSRVYLGVHYASDVVCGWALGICLYIIFFTIYEYFYPLKYQFTYNQPAWGDMQKKHPWKKPHAHTDAEDMVSFPKNRAPWRKPKPIRRHGLHAEKSAQEGK